LGRHLKGAPGPDYRLWGAIEGQGSEVVCGKPGANGRSHDGASGRADGFLDDETEVEQARSGADVRVKARA
jgi:hypothetical protein